MTVKAAASIQVLLEEDMQMVDEVVVTGYTTQRKADLTGAVSVVKVDEIQKQGENNPVKALQGRVPGMNITADGNPSGTATVRIRGIGTLNNNDPLYIIDGVPSKAGMHELNGNDIESIQVLKMRLLLLFMVRVPQMVLSSLLLNKVGKDRSRLISTLRFPHLCTSLN